MEAIYYTAPWKLRYAIVELQKRRRVGGGFTSSDSEHDVVAAHANTGSGRVTGQKFTAGFISDMLLSLPENERETASVSWCPTGALPTLNNWGRVCCLRRIVGSADSRCWIQILRGKLCISISPDGGAGFKRYTGFGYKVGWVHP